MTILIAVLVLGVLIFVHELGHFLLAKWNGVGVLEFAIGFGKPLWQRQIGETLYSLRVIPLGGYVRMVGDDIRQISGEMEEAKLEDPEAEADVHPNARALMQDRSRWFLEKGFLAKSSIVIAGPLFNILFALLLSIVSVFIYGLSSQLDEPVIGDVIPGYPAQRAGLQANDRILSIDGKPIEDWEELRQTIHQSAGRELAFVVARPDPATGESRELTLSFSGTSDTSELDVLEGRQPDGSVKIGIIPSFELVPATFGEALYAGTLHTWGTSIMVVRGVKALVTTQVSARHISGPIGIFREVSKSAARGFEYVLSITVFLSISLAILNLLPIPILDGGHLMFFVIELLKGGRVSLRVHELANQVGMALLLLLMFFAVGNDLIGIVFPEGLP